MSHNKELEAFGIILRDLIRHDNLKHWYSCGDFEQFIPVIPKSTGPPVDISVHV